MCLVVAIRIYAFLAYHPWVWWGLSTVVIGVGLGIETGRPVVGVISTVVAGAFLYVLLVRVIAPQFRQALERAKGA